MQILSIYAIFAIYVNLCSGLEQFFVPVWDQRTKSLQIWRVTVSQQPKGKLRSQTGLALP